MPATATQCHSMTSYYVKLYRAKYAKEPKINRNIAKQGFAGMLMDLSIDRAKELIDYYFNLDQAGTKDHSLNWFLYNYDKVAESLQDSKRRESVRIKLMQESRDRAREWETSGKSRITSSELSIEE